MATAELSARRWSTTLRHVRRKVSRDRVTLSASSLAYNWFLALFPAVISLVGLLTILRLSAATIHQITHAVDTALPPGTADVLNAAVLSATKRHSSSPAAFVVGLVVATWSASSGASALQEALDVAYEVPSDRGFLGRRLWGIPLMVATVLLGGGGAALLVFGAPLGHAVEGHVGPVGFEFSVLWTIVRWTATAVAVNTLISVFYTFGPNRPRANWCWMSTGSVFATAVFLAASLGFSFYVAKFGSYGRTYGSFAGVAILIFWLYLTGIAVLIGGELNAELERQAEASTRA